MSLINAQDTRIVGDYEFGPEVPEEKALLRIVQAEEFLELAKERIGPIPNGPG